MQRQGRHASDAVGSDHRNRSAAKKALVSQDASGNTWLSYNDPRWLAKRHGLGDEGDQALDAMAAALDAIAKAATSSCS